MGYILIQEAGELIPFMEQILSSPLIGVDTETTGLNPRTDRLRLIQLACRHSPILVIDCFSFLPKGLPLLTRIFTSGLTKIFQNAKFDLQFFLHWGISVKLPLFDTMLAAQVLRSSEGPSRANLAALARHYLQIELPKEEQRSDFSGVLRNEQLEYAANDAAILLKLYDVMTPLIEKNRLSEVSRLEFACVRAVAQMEYHGIYLDLEKWDALRRKTVTERDQALEKLYEYSGRPFIQMSLFDEGTLMGMNFDSNKQMLGLLHRFGILVEDTSHHSLMAYGEHPLVVALLEYRRASKSLSTFLDPLPLLAEPPNCKNSPSPNQKEGGRLHPHYGQIGAWSGRMSCSGPNIQQIPRDTAFRSCFIAPDGKKLVLADYSQIELRVAARIAGDSRMITAYKNNEDLHRLTASLLSGTPAEGITKALRQSAKAVNFGLIFAMGPAGLQAYSKDTYGVDMTLEDATAFRRRFFEAYPGIAAWHQRLKNHPPLEIRTLAGRKHVFEENPGLSMLSNTPVQGTAADIVKQAMGMLVDELEPRRAFIVAVVHDEILIECQEGDAAEVAGILKETMEQAGERYLSGSIDGNGGWDDVPTVAEVGIADSWAEK